MLSPSNGYRLVVMLYLNGRNQKSNCRKFLFEVDGGKRVKSVTHSVTPADQMSTLNPEKVSSPLAISGGWKAGEP